MQPWIKPTPWNGEDLEGDFQVTYKIDGVQVRLYPDGRTWSRADKPLYNLAVAWSDHWMGYNRQQWQPPFIVCEVFPGSLKAAIQAVRTQRPGTPQVPTIHVFQLWPRLDDRLTDTIRDDMLHNPKADQIRRRMEIAMVRGFEGLVLRGKDRWLKVKPEETHDVNVTGILAGTGKHKGRMGALLIGGAGKVGTGFNDKERELWWARRHKIKSGEKLYCVEVACMGVNPTGAFRHARYVRDRTWDKFNEGQQ